MSGGNNSTDKGKTLPIFAADVSIKNITIRITQLEVLIGNTKECMELVGLRNELLRRKRLFSTRIKREMVKT